MTETGIGRYSEVTTAPVTDWASDFNHLDPAWTTDPYPILDDLRQRCPVAHTERFGGVWLPTRYEDVAAVAHDTDTVFVPVRRGEQRAGRPAAIAPVGPIPPISSDPPFHSRARKLLLPGFTRAAAARLEPATRPIATSCSTDCWTAGPSSTPPPSTRSTSRPG